jgi:hypothetical protein
VIRRWPSILISLLVLMVACAGQAPLAPAVLPLDQMPGGVEGPEVVDDLGTSVVVRFTSGVPTVCNVAYGTDTSYGQLATMPMMGGAVREHAVSLTSLTPNTIYHYKITLTDGQARVYQSEDLTFTSASPSQPVERPEGINVASAKAGATITGVSSNFGGGDNKGTFGAERAIDGDPSTEWSSNGDGDDAWIEIQFDRAYNVQTIGFWTRTMPNGTAQIFSFAVITDEGETHGPFDLPDANQMYYFPVDFRAHALRFDAVTTNTGNTGAVEIEAYGTPHEVTRLTPSALRLASAKETDGA